MNLKRHSLNGKNGSVLAIQSLKAAAERLEREGLAPPPWATGVSNQPPTKFVLCHHLICSL
jgi:hypothetical protein